MFNFVLSATAPPAPDKNDHCPTPLFVGDCASKSAELPQTPWSTVTTVAVTVLFVITISSVVEQPWSVIVHVNVFVPKPKGLTTKL